MAGLRKSLTQFQKSNKEKPEEKDSIKTVLSIKLTKLAVQLGKGGN